MTAQWQDYKDALDLSQALAKELQARQSRAGAGLQQAGLARLGENVASLDRQV